MPVFIMRIDRLRHLCNTYEMKRINIIVVTLMVLGAALHSYAGAAQGASASAEVPDIMGIWDLYPDPLVGEDFFAETPIPNGGPKLKQPYARQWQAIRAEREAKLKAGTPLPDSSTLCIPEGMPLIMGAIMPLQILQTPGQITVLAEFLTQTRRIYLDRPMPAPEDISPSYYGFSVGQWQDDTLVVTTRGVKEDVRFFDIPHSSDITIIERIRRTGPDLMENQITIEDPQVLAEPYRFTYGYRRNHEYQMMEYFCDRQDPLLELNEDGTVEMKMHADE